MLKKQSFMFWLMVVCASINLVCAISMSAMGQPIGVVSAIALMSFSIIFAQLHFRKESS